MVQWFGIGAAALAFAIIFGRGARSGDLQIGRSGDRNR
jgi:cytochrome oxidase assembly protein ShyY1